MIRESEDMPQFVQHDRIHVVQSRGWAIVLGETGEGIGNRALKFRRVVGSGIDKNAGTVAVPSLIQDNTAGDGPPTIQRGNVGAPSGPTARRRHGDVDIDVVAPARL